MSYPKLFPIGDSVKMADLIVMKLYENSKRAYSLVDTRDERRQRCEEFRSTKSRASSGSP